MDAVWLRSKVLQYLLLKIWKNNWKNNYNKISISDSNISIICRQFHINFGGRGGGGRGRLRDLKLPQVILYEPSLITVGVMIILIISRSGGT